MSRPSSNPGPPGGRAASGQRCHSLSQSSWGFASRRVSQFVPGQEHLREGAGCPGPGPGGDTQQRAHSHLPAWGPGLGGSARLPPRARSSDSTAVPLGTGVPQMQPLVGRPGGTPPGPGSARNCLVSVTATLMTLVTEQPSQAQGPWSPGVLPAPVRTSRAPSPRSGVAEAASPWPCPSPVAAWPCGSHGRHCWLVLCQGPRPAVPVWGHVLLLSLQCDGAAVSCRLAAPRGPGVSPLSPCQRRELWVGGCGRPLDPR